MEFVMVMLTCFVVRPKRVSFFVDTDNNGLDGTKHFTSLPSIT